jgi:hypothetical protein
MTFNRLTALNAIELQNVKGGKRYGLVSLYTTAGLAAYREYTAAGANVTAQMVGTKILRFVNSKGDEICIEW